MHKDDKIKLHALVNDALKQWVDLMQTDPEAERLCGWHEITAAQTYKELREAQRLDDTGLTTCMVLRAMVEEELLESKFTYHELLNDAEGVRKKLAPLKKLKETLDTPWVIEKIDTFIEGLREAVEHYKVDAKEWENIFDNKMDVAYLRRDALKSFKELRAHQFSFGDWEDVPIKYNEHVCQFWNVNSLLAGIGSSPVPAVTICIVRDTAVSEFSYFAFALRNGGNLIVLTDKTDTAHPLQKYMARKPGRDLEKRMFEHHFPYQYLGVELTEDSDHAKLKGTPGLVRYKAKADIVGQFNKMDVDQILWAIMLLDRIREKFWVQRKALPSQSYTAEMIQKPRALLDAVEHLPMVIQETLEMPRLTVEDIGSKQLIEEGQWKEKFGENKPTGVNDWMEERYGNLVKEDHLNLLGTEQIPLLLSDKERHKERGFFAPKKVERSLTALDPTEFGSKEELLKDFKWHARYNQVVTVQEAAKKEFLKEKDKVVAWFKEAVKKNLPKLELAIGKGEFISVAQVTGKSFDWSKEEKANILSIVGNEKYSYPRGHGFWGASWVIFGKKKPTFDFCYKTEGRASVFVEFKLMTPQAIAAVCDCDVEELPFFLQHYYENEPYTGNPILDRIDPMEWVAVNPWRELALNVLFCISKRQYNRLRKQAGQKRFTDWKSIEYS
jgi:hypothetical protein